MASIAGAPIANAVGAGAVPRHANEERPVMAIIGRPPILRIRHQGMQILDHGIEVEGLEFRRIIERHAHRIGLGGVLVENMQVQLVRPPITIDPGQNSLVSLAAAHDRALAFVRHFLSSLCFDLRQTSRSSVRYLSGPCQSPGPLAGMTSTSCAGAGTLYRPIAN